MVRKRIFNPFDDREEEIVIDRETVSRHWLEAWAERFQLGTAGYRDLENVDDLHDLDVPFNPVTMAVITAAAARLYQAGDQIHLGGEVRPWTREFIDLAARIYAARGIVCRLRGETDEDGPITTTPIWLSSFGVFFEDLAGGENFTASHSQNFKGGRKPMDGRGMQLLEQAAVIENGVREQIRAAAAGETVTIRLAPAGSPLIRSDLSLSAPYLDYIRTIVPDPLLAEIRDAGRAGFRVAISTEGGSMGRTTRKLFRALELPAGEGEVIRYLHFREDSGYYGIGLVDGVNHGVDPGKWQVYKNIGAQDELLSGRADVVFLWDPDGDRFNMVTSAPAALAGRALMNGLEVDPGDARSCIVYFKPNQIYFMLLALRLESGRSSGLLDRHAWLLMETYPTSRSLAELAARFSVPTFRTPVGFKHFGDALVRLEAQMAAGAGQLELADTRGRRHGFPAGTRILLMAEESGGAAMGGESLFASRSGRNHMLALKEKDGFQVGLLALALGARLHLEGGSFAGFYLDRLDRYRIRHRCYERRDLTLFDESLRGDRREEAMSAGNRRKDRTVSFFRRLASRVEAGELNPGETTRFLQERVTAGYVVPPVADVYWAGDGTLIEFDGAWCQLRASGTDAVLRYYAEGETREEVRSLNQALIDLRLDE